MKPAPRTPQVTTEPSAGRPAGLSALAAMLLRLRARKAARLVVAEANKAETTGATSHT